MATSTQLQSWAWFQIKGNLVSFPRHRDKNRVDRNLKGSAEVRGLHLEKSTGSLVLVLSDAPIRTRLRASTVVSGALQVMSDQKVILFLLLLRVLEIAGFFGQ